MKTFRLIRLLIAAALAVIGHEALAADFAEYRASAPPGRPGDANEKAAQVWEVRRGSGTGTGLAQVADDPHAWQIFCFQSGAGSITQTHTFAGGALTEGQAVSLDYAHNSNIDSGKRVGLRLLDASGRKEIEICFIGGQQSFVYSDATIHDGPAGQPYDPKEQLRFVFRITGPLAYSASLDGNVWTGTFNDPIAQIQVFDDGAGPDSDQYTDNLIVSTREPAQIGHEALIGPRIAMFVPQNYDPKLAPSLALATPPQEKGALPGDWRLVPKFFTEAGKAGACIDVPAGSSLYGTGEVTGPLLRNGKSITLWNTDNFNYGAAGGVRLYQSHPWVLGVRPDGSAFGIIFNTTWKADLATGSDKITMATEGAPFRVIVLDRESPREVLRGLANLTGKMPMPPEWALGFHQCRYSYYPDAKVREIADEFRKRHLPCDVIWMDIDYMKGFRIFTFDPKRFPDPKSTNDYLHENGFHSVWMIDPGVMIDPDYFVHQTGEKRNVWVQTKSGEPFIGSVWPGKCNFPDFTRPETRDWWGGLYKDYIANGIDGVWNDMNEPSVFYTPTKTMPEDNHHRGGGELPDGPHLMYHNVFGMLMVSASRQGILAARPEKRPFLLTRSNYLGGQRYAATWTGDNNSALSFLQTAIPMSENLGLSGQPLSGPDIGGYAGSITPDLYGKWISMAPFFPFCRAHTSNENPPREPWVFGPKIESVARTALDRRYRLLPYLYTLAYNASTQGDPIMQPVFFADPKDPYLRAEDGAFLLGSDLLVVPQFSTNPRLPKGIWRKISLLDPKLEADGYQATVKIRGGAILPLGRVVENTNEKLLDPLTLVVCLDENGTASGDLYEDAGDGFGYRKGEYAMTHYEAAREANDVVVKIAQRSGGLKVADRQIQVQLITDGGAVQGTGSESQGVRVSNAPAGSG